jgi:hypothetical protein
MNNATTSCLSLRARELRLGDHLPVNVGTPNEERREVVRIEPSDRYVRVHHEGYDGIRHVDYWDRDGHLLQVERA